MSPRDTQRMSRAGLFNLVFPQFIQNRLFWVRLQIYFGRILGAYANCRKVLVRGRLGGPLQPVELFGMQNTLERYVAEGLAVSRLLVVHNGEVRFYNCGARKDCRKSPAELLKTNETILRNSRRVFETSSNALLQQHLPQRICAL
jgi:hypothetical protein